MRLVILSRSDSYGSYFFIALSTYPWILGSKYIEIYFLHQNYGVLMGFVAFVLVLSHHKIHE